MDYLLKSSAIIALFFFCYKLFLQRETFFVANRLFLLSGLVLSILVPLIVIPIYLDYTPLVFEKTSMPSANFSNASTIATPRIKNTFSFLQLGTIIYAIGAVFFLGKLLMELMSLSIFIKKHQSYKDTSFYCIETDSDLAPFSFFKWIVYNPNQFNDAELTLILNHEKVHARQLHSLDIIISQVVCAVFWINPIMWLYKKVLQQNLEFIADRESHAIASNKKSYENLLLKTSTPSHQLAMTNNFYNSIIKKRIVMLHTSKSNKLNAYKYALILPLLALFVFNFNTKTIAQTANQDNATGTKTAQNVLKFRVTKNTKDTQLQSIKEKLAEQKAMIVFDNIIRNDQKEITGIKIDFEHNGSKGNFFINSDNAITDIEIALNVNENKLSVGQSQKSLSQSFDIITDDDGEKKVKTAGSGTNVFVYSTDEDSNEDEKVIVTGKDGVQHEVKKEKKVYVIKSGSTKNSDENGDEVFVKKSKKDTIWLKTDVKNIIWTDDNGSDVEIITVERGNNFQIITDGENQPLILLDGKEIPKKDMDKVKPDSIDSVNVLKGESATKKYGEKGKNGVIEITSKKN